MIEETIVISDTNILFDLLSGGLMEAFCQLPCEKYTSDFVFHEIQSSSELKTIYKKMKLNDLRIYAFDYEELMAIDELKRRDGCGSLSMADCSVWYLADKLKGRLLTGDRRLRTVSESAGTKVSGILFVIDSIVEYGILSPSIVADKLLTLMNDDSRRLPKPECEKRIKQWKNQ